ncbi:MAG: hypothetical protein ACP5I1_15905, partial [Candidatus Hinthialibacter sp.]
ISKPKNEWDSPNRGTCMAVLEEKASAEGKVMFCVLMTPGACSESVEKEWRFTPLKEWKDR